jgi:hypothetical protein
MEYKSFEPSETGVIGLEPGCENHWQQVTYLLEEVWI